MAYVRMTTGYRQSKATVVIELHGNQPEESAGYLAPNRAIEDVRRRKTSIEWNIVPHENACHFWLRSLIVTPWEPA